MEFEGAGLTKPKFPKKENSRDFESITLCRPLGGINDVLCQIEYSRKLSSSLGRSLVVVTETGSPGLSHRFEIPFHNAFAFSDTRRVSRVEAIAGAGIDDLDDRLENIVESDVQLLSNSLSELTRGVQDQCRLSLAEGLRQRKTRILLHESWGGGLRSATLLKHLAFVPELENLLHTLSQIVPENSVGFHFRNTDYKSDVDVLLKELISIPQSQTIIVGSDDVNLLAMLQQKLPNHRLLSASSFVNEAAIAIHPTIKALFELMVLAFCDVLILIPLARTEVSSTWFGDQLPSYSGFARLVKHVWAVRMSQRKGFLAFLGQQESLQGLSGFQNPVLKVLYLSLFELPRIFIQAKFPAGVYRQLTLFQRAP